jgi:hypothetical protein
MRLKGLPAVLPQNSGLLPITVQAAATPAINLI